VLAFLTFRCTSLLDLITARLETASPMQSVTALALPLLFACGRRSSELMSVDSVFAATESPHYCSFTGVLKKRGRAATIRIALLVPFPTFAIGLAALRSRQARNGDAAGLAPAQIKRRYQPGLDRELAHRGLPGLPPCTVHTLRSVYAMYVHEIFVSPYSFNKTGQLALHHANLKESLHYNAIRLDHLGCHKHSKGTLHL
jgi:integrase